MHPGSFSPSSPSFSPEPAPLFSPAPPMVILIIIPMTMDIISTQLSHHYFYDQVIPEKQTPRARRTKLTKLVCKWLKINIDNHFHCGYIWVLKVDEGVKKMTEKSRQGREAAEVKVPKVLSGYLLLCWLFDWSKSSCLKHDWIIDILEDCLFE